MCDPLWGLKEEGSLRDVAEPTRPFGEPGVGGVLGGSFWLSDGRTETSEVPGAWLPWPQGPTRKQMLGQWDGPSEKATITFISRFPAILFSKSRPPSLPQNVPFVTLGWVLL